MHYPRLTSLNTLITISTAWFNVCLEVRCDVSFSHKYVKICTQTNKYLLSILKPCATSETVFKSVLEFVSRKVGYKLTLLSDSKTFREQLYMWYICSHNDSFCYLNLYNQWYSNLWGVGLCLINDKNYKQWRKLNQTLVIIH